MNFRNLVHTLAVLVMIGLSNVAKSQIDRADSLRSILDAREYRSSDEHLSVLSQYANACMGFDLPKATGVANEQLQLARREKKSEYEADANETLGRILYIQGRNDSASIHLKEAISLFERIPNLEHRCIEAKSYLANVYRITANYDEAIELYNEALAHYERVKDDVWVAKILANIGSLYYTAGNQAKGEEYTLRALNMQRINGDTQGEVISLVNLTVFALNNDNFEQGIRYGEEALSKLKPINISYYASALIRVGYCFYMLGQADRAIAYTLEAIDIYKENRSSIGLMEGYRTLGDYYMDTKQYALAKQIGLEALQHADSTSRLDLRLLFDLLKRASIYLNQPEDALMYSSKQLKMKEEDTSRDWAEKIAEVEAKYQTVKKDSEIKQLQATRRIQNTLIVSLLFTILAGGLGSIALVRGNKQKRLLAEQKLVQMENERKLVATHALLEGENAERVRLSKDLHDGLGGLLTVAKQKIVGMKGSLTIPEDQVEPFNTALRMLDQSIGELRRVAHNLMPESLVRYGLNSAIADFCSSIDSVNYHFYGMERRLDDKLEVTVFRIANELINNALKHAQPATINVQLVQEENRVSLTVHDDGCGFDTNAIDSARAGGLKNIETRVISFNGRWDIYSSLGKGTEISVEFKC